MIAMAARVAVGADRAESPMLHDQQLQRTVTPFYGWHTPRVRLNATSASSIGTAVGMCLAKPDLKVFAKWR